MARMAGQIVFVVCLCVFCVGRMVYIHTHERRGGGKRMKNQINQKKDNFKEERISQKNKLENLNLPIHYKY